jgi:hypothetical protein
MTGRSCLSRAKSASTPPPPVPEPRCASERNSAVKVRRTHPVGLLAVLAPGRIGSGTPGRFGKCALPFLDMGILTDMTGVLATSEPIDLRDLDQVEERGHPRSVVLGAAPQLLSASFH